MGQGGWPALLGWMIAAAALSALLTVLTIRYAHRRRMVDQPGQRRSHSVPTARGGGIAIVTSLLVCGLLSTQLPEAAVTADPGRWLASMTLAILIVAAVGWIDDRSGLSARIRFICHCIAAITLLAPVFLALHEGGLQDSASSVLIVAIVIALLACVLAIVW